MLFSRSQEQDFNTYTEDLYSEKSFNLLKSITKDHGIGLRVVNIYTVSKTLCSLLSTEN